MDGARAQMLPRDSKQPGKLLFCPNRALPAHYTFRPSSATYPQRSLFSTGSNRLQISHWDYIVVTDMLLENYWGYTPVITSIFTPYAPCTSTCTIAFRSHGPPIKRCCSHQDHIWIFFQICWIVECAWKILNGLATAREARDIA